MSCWVCGTDHEGKCPPSAFNYFKCTACGKGQQLPADACFGMDRVFCCSDTVPASELWQSINYEQYVAIEAAKISQPGELQ